MGPRVQHGLTLLHPAAGRLHRGAILVHLRDMDKGNARTTQHFGFLLLPNVALMSFAAATEPLRAANLLAGVPLYRASNFSADGAPVMASNGLPIPCLPLPAPDLHTLFVCAGGGPDDWHRS